MSMEINGYGNYQAVGANSALESKKSNSSDYFNYLKDKYDCVKDGSVNISPVYLRKCANDKDAAKELEENLSFFKESCKDGYNNAKSYLGSLGDELVDYSESWDIDETGNVTMVACVSGRTRDGDTKVYKERKTDVEKKIAEKRAKQRAEKKKAERKAQEEKLRAKSRFDVKA